MHSWNQLIENGLKSLCSEHCARWPTNHVVSILTKLSEIFQIHLVCNALKRTLGTYSEAIFWQLEFSKYFIIEKIKWGTCKKIFEILKIFLRLNHRELLKVFESKVKVIGTSQWKNGTEQFCWASDLRTFAWLKVNRRPVNNFGQNQSNTFQWL